MKDEETCQDPAGIYMPNPYEPVKPTESFKIEYDSLTKKITFTTGDGKMTMRVRDVSWNMSCVQGLMPKAILSGESYGEFIPDIDGVMGDLSMQCSFNNVMVDSAYPYEGLAKS